MAAQLKTKGLSVAAIARKLHASDVAVRGWLKKQHNAIRASDERQLGLF